MNAIRARPKRQPVEKQSSFIKTVPADELTAVPAPYPADNTPEKQRGGPIGTRRAIIGIVSSGASSLERRWGGRRNSASRTSDCLSLNQAANIIAAAQFSVAIGLPFNRHLTIHWEHAGIADVRAAWATGRFLKLAGDWIKKRRKNGSSIAWAWVRENGESKGSHVHILLHVPAGMSLGRMQRRWVSSITGKPYQARTIRTARIAGTAGAANAAPAAYLANLEAVVAYVLKGASPEAAQELGLERLEHGGRIVGKRAATSQNVGAKAR